MAIGYPPCCSTRRLHHLWRQLSSQYSIESFNSFLISVEALKQRIVSYAAHLRKYFKQNFLFRSNETAFYSGLLKRNNVVPPAPDISQLKSFWRNIYEKNSLANLNCLWLNDLQSHVNSSRSFVADSPGFTMPCFVDCLRKLCSWAAPGPDGIQGF